MSIYSKTVGILGGGQLARMLVLKAHQMGLHTIVLAEKSSEPAVKVSNRWVKGSIHSAKDIKLLMKLTDVITFESEFVPAKLIKQAQQGLAGKKVYPQLSTLARLQDRLQQKEWLCDYNIPTLDHVKISSKDDFDLAFDAFNKKIVIKKRMGGYDGYGTFVIKSVADLKRFKKRFKGEETNFIVEPFVSFKSEKSLIFARNTKGEIVSLPLVQSVQKNNQCDYVFGPTHHQEEAKIKKQISFFLNQIDYVGVIAFELFDMGAQLLVNEIAPRVHNTGHFSQDSLHVDQFELHLRSILGMSLPEPELKKPAFVMVNLLGSTQRKPKLNKVPTGSIHWYDKIENRPRRKMGHINYIGLDKNKLLKKALSERKGISI